MRLDIADQAFRAAAERWLASLADDTVRDLRSVFAESPGYYPTTLQELWSAEVARRGLEPTQTLAEAVARSPRVPVGHPEDSDWRFTEATTDDLLGRVLRRLSLGAVVAHLGTPSTFVAGVRKHSD